MRGGPGGRVHAGGGVELRVRTCGNVAAQQVVQGAGAGVLQLERAEEGGRKEESGHVYSTLLHSFAGVSLSNTPSSPHSLLHTYYLMINNHASSPSLQ